MSREKISDAESGRRTGICLSLQRDEGEDRHLPVPPATSAQGGVTRRGVVLTYLLSLVIGSQ